MKGTPGSRRRSPAPEEVQPEKRTRSAADPVCVSCASPDNSWIWTDDATRRGRCSRCALSVPPPAADGDTRYLELHAIDVALTAGHVPFLGRCEALSDADLRNAIVLAMGLDRESPDWDGPMYRGKLAVAPWEAVAEARVHLYSPGETLVVRFANWIELARGKPYPLVWINQDNPTHSNATKGSRLLRMARELYGIRGPASEREDLISGGPPGAVPVGGAEVREPRAFSDDQSSASAGLAVEIVREPRTFGSPVLDGEIVDPEGSSSAPSRHEIVEAAIALGRAAGRAEAYRHVHLVTRAAELATLQRVKEEKAYKLLGHTWKSYCTEVLRRDRQEVDELLANYQALGAELVEVVQALGLSRDALRALRAVPTDQLPRLLPSGDAIEIGDEVLPLDDRQVVGRILDLVQSERAERRTAETERDREREKLAALAKKLEEAMATIAVGEQDNGRLQRDLDSIRLLRGDLEDAAVDVNPAVRRGMHLTHLLATFADDVITGRTDQEMVRHLLTPLQFVFTRLIRYAGGMEDEQPASPAASTTPPPMQPAIDRDAVSRIALYDDEE